MYNSKQISPISMNSLIVDNVPSDNFLERVNNYGISPQPQPQQQHGLQLHDIILERSPKDDLNYNPTQEATVIYADESQKNTGMNGNWIRGNQFSDDYDFNKVFRRDKYDVIVQGNMRKKNPTIISDSPFYPYPNFMMRYDPKYKSYPVQNAMTADGRPIIRYPYQFLEGFSNTDSSLETNLLFIILMTVFISFYLLFFTGFGRGGGWRLRRG